MKKNLRIIWLIILWTSQSVLAGEIYQFYRGSRSLGMGGAGVAVVNDETALLVNPAGLGKLRDSYGTILDPEVELGNNLTSIYKAKAFSNPYDIASVLPSVQQSPDTYYHAKAQLFPSYVVRNFGIGIFGRYSLDTQLVTGQSTMQTNYYNDLALVLGYNLRLWDGRIKIGVAGRFLNRIEVNKVIDPTGDLTLATHAAEGAAIGTDVGLTLAAPWYMIPTISVVSRDVGNTQFNAGSGLRMTTTNHPNTINQDYDVAVAIFPIHSKYVRTTWTLEYQKITEASKATDKSRYYHGGMEFNIADTLFVRAGMNQKYWTAGLELATEHTQFMMTSYGEDVGADGASVEDRRFAMKFSVRF